MTKNRNKRPISYTHIKREESLICKEIVCRVRDFFTLSAVCKKRLLPDILAEVLHHAVHQFHILAGVFQGALTDLVSLINAGLDIFFREAETAK